MKMTLNQLIRELQSHPDDIKEKDVFVKAENGLLLTPVLRKKLIDKYDAFNTQAENVDFLVITY